MTKLTEEIKISIEKLDRETPRPLTSEDQAEAASEVCKGYIERAFDAGHDRGLWVEGTREEKEPMHKVDFLKSEGINRMKSVFFSLG